MYYITIFHKPTMKIVLECTIRNTDKALELASAVAQTAKLLGEDYKVFTHREEAEEAEEA